MLRVAILAVAAFTASAQSFEVASIKPSGPNSVRGWEGGPGSRSPERYTYGQATIQDLVVAAYDIDYFQVASKLSLDRERFDVAVTMPPSTTKEQFRTMMRNLLTERFHLKAHVESRPFSAYELIVAKGGAKLAQASDNPSPPPEGFPQIPPGRRGFRSMNTVANGYILTRATARQMPMSMLADFLRMGGDPVVDRTGLDGKYDFTLEFAKETPNADTSALHPPIMETAIQQQLGLQLVRKKLPFDVVVVDSFDRMPTEN